VTAAAAAGGPSRARHRAGRGRGASGCGARGGGASGRGRAGWPSRPRLMAGSGIAARAAVCGLCLGLAPFAAMKEMSLRGLEARLAGHLIGLVTRMHAGSSPAIAVIWFSPHRNSDVGLQVTPECTVALLVIPFLLATAAMVWVRPRPVWPVAGLLLATALLMIMNQVRLLVIAWLVQSMGFSSGFYWGHTIAGSIITICGLAVVLAIFALVAIRKGKTAQ
jgi:exosortase/archaeosortase family protein